MRVRSLLVAQSVIVDVHTNSASIIGVLDEFGALSFPVVMPGFAVYAAVQREPNDPVRVPTRVHMTLDEKELARVDAIVDFQSYRRTRAIYRIEGLVVPSPGSLAFSLEADDREIGRYVVEITAPTATGAPPAVSN
jgi:hypothetical protein